MPLKCDIPTVQVPPWVQKETHIEPAEQIESPNWTDRGTADGNSVQPDSDFGLYRDDESCYCNLN